MKNSATANVRGHQATRLAAMPHLMGSANASPDRLPVPEVTYVDWAEWERASLLARMGIDLTGSARKNSGR